MGERARRACQSKPFHKSLRPFEGSRAVGSSWSAWLSANYFEYLNMCFPIVPRIRRMAGLAGCVVPYVRRPFQREPDFSVTSVNYAPAELLARGEAPS